jgi:hypothetical protein
LLCFYIGLRPAEGFFSFASHAQQGERSKNAEGERSKKTKAWLHRLLASPSAKRSKQRR